MSDRGTGFDDLGISTFDVFTFISVASMAKPATMYRIGGNATARKGITHAALEIAQIADSDC
ncbi:hypothetical protein GCM10011309_02410 [Litorimonas cladophorae]|uniref:Uncharacterized protein n=1 Tax=Litorimonas cladophorae TaxID=1220491 RepID=A0A918KBD6_9PROT|nr:hypothetical protein GCM10011309_02410 [Litorimonas cladophorae]